MTATRVHHYILFVLRTSTRNWYIYMMSEWLVALRKRVKTSRFRNQHLLFAECWCHRADGICCRLDQEGIFLVSSYNRRQRMRERLYLYLRSIWQTNAMGSKNTRCNVHVVLKSCARQRQSSERILSVFGSANGDVCRLKIKKQLKKRCIFLFVEMFTCSRVLQSCNTMPSRTHKRNHQWQQ